MFRRVQTKSCPTQLNPTQPSLSLTPGDILIDIATCLELQSDLLNFSLASKYIFSEVSSILYETVILNSVDQCCRTLEMLQHRIDIARHVRQLIVRPKSTRGGWHETAANAIVSSVVRQAAMTTCLDALTKFVWDGEERPHYDDMWFALRVGCPQLRCIGTTIGTDLPAHNSHLYDFTNLCSFSLTLKSGFYHTQVNMFLEDPDTASRRLWDMLIHRCPNLEELTVKGISSLPTDIHRLVDGRWPKLRALTLGDVSIDCVPGPVDPTQKRPFIAFLEAHPTLESLGLSRFTIQPTHFSSLKTPSLQLSSFSGTLQQIQSLPYDPSYLRSVTFCDPIRTREVSTQTVAGILRGLPSLTELKISLVLHPLYDSGYLLCSLVSACPHLRHLELACRNNPSFQLGTFAKALRGFTKLRSLHLTIVKYPGDECLPSGADQIAKSNPRLTKFFLTFIPPQYPLSLPFSFPFSFAYPPLLIPAKVSGSFTLSCDQHGLPLHLSGFKHIQIVWPMGLGVFSRTTKYASDLRPLGSQGRKKKVLTQVMSLAFEQSLAGREMRIVLFCALLTFMAIWGFIAIRGKADLIHFMSSSRHQHHPAQPHLTEHGPPHPYKYHPRPDLCDVFTSHSTHRTPDHSLSANL